MTKLNIPRLPGESEADFQRRYCREKMRIYRASRPKAPRKPRGKNKAPYKTSDLTQEEWEATRQQPGEDDAAYRKRYARERVAKYRERHRGRLREERLADYAENKAAILEKVRRRKEAKPEVYKAQSRRHFAKYREAKISALEAWGRANKDRLKEAKRAWNEANPGLLASYSAKWRECCRLATPAWVDFDKIRVVYEEAARLTAETGIPHEVDHMIPVQGKTVCGLHVHTNLRVITAAENSKKRNKLLPELLRALGYHVS